MSKKINIFALDIARLLASSLVVFPQWAHARPKVSVLLSRQPAEGRTAADASPGGAEVRS